MQITFVFCTPGFCGFCICVTLFWIFPPQPYHHHLKHSSLVAIFVPVIIHHLWSNLLCSVRVSEWVTGWVFPSQCKKQIRTRWRKKTKKNPTTKKHWITGYLLTLLMLAHTLYVDNRYIDDKPRLIIPLHMSNVHALDVSSARWRRIRTEICSLAYSQ